MGDLLYELSLLGYLPALSTQGNLRCAYACAVACYLSGMSIKVCNVSGCTREAGVPGSARGWCRAHYRRWQRYGTVNESSRRTLTWRGVACAVVDCEDRAYGHGYCQPHWSKWRRTGDPLGSIPKAAPVCMEDGCDKLAKARGLCSTHYSRWRRRDQIAASAEKRQAAVEDRKRLCERCGASFSVQRSTALGRYCSVSCKNVAMEKKIALSCGQCGLEVVRRAGDIGRSRSGLSFCSIKCSARWRSANRTAIRFPGGIPEHARDIYGRKCVICGEDRQVHYAHKKSAASGGTIHPSNIYVLCPTHHAILDNAPHLLTEEEHYRLRTSEQVSTTEHPCWGTSAVPRA